MLIFDEFDNTDGVVLCKFGIGLQNYIKFLINNDKIVILIDN